MGINRKKAVEMASGNSNVTITKDTGTIEAGAFSGLSNLATVTTGKITKVEDGAFSNCPCLREVKLERVEEVGQGLFNESVNLEKVTVKEDGPKIAYLIAKDLICNGPMQAIDIYMGESFYKTVSQRRPCITKKHAADFILLGFVDCEVTDRFSPDDETKINTIKKGAFEGIDIINEVDATKILYIEDEAFKGCENLKNISLGNIEKIGENVFSGCTSLERVSVADEGQVELIKKSLEACGLTQKIDICIGDEVKVSINNTENDTENDGAPLDEAEKTEDPAARGNVRQIESEDALSKLIKRINYEGRRIQKIELGSNISEIPNNAFKENEVLDEINLDSIKRIGNYSFSGCEKLNHIRLSSIESIGKGAFSGCSELSKVEEMSKNIIIIEKFTFSRCQKLESIDLSGIKKICERAFSLCSALTEINLSSIDEIEDDAFKGCNFTKIITSNEDQKLKIKENLRASGVIEDSTDVDALIIIE